MALIFVFFAFSATVICIIPVKIVLQLRIGEKIRLSSGAAPFSAKLASGLARRHAQGKKKPPLISRWIKSAHKRSRLGAYFEALKYFYRHLSFDRITAHGTLSLTDAAQTAMVCGAANALGAALVNYSSVSIDLQADFSAAHSDALACGMFSIRAGHIIMAAVRGAAHYIREEFAQWKNTRLKTS